MKFRLMKPEEIQCRVSIVKPNGIALLLYKDQMVVQNILDETVGPMNWRDSYQQIGSSLFCTIEIYDEKKKEWVGKTSNGAESNTDALKGLATDAMKRAATLWGIGRELYSAPFIWVDAAKTVIKDNKVKDSFSVAAVEYDENDKISYLVIRNSKGSAVYAYGSPAKGKAVKVAEASPEPEKAEPKEAPKTAAKTTPKQEKLKTLKDKCEKDHVNMVLLAKCYKKGKIDDLTLVHIDNALEHWDQVKGSCKADPNEIPA